MNGPLLTFLQCGKRGPYVFASHDYESCCYGILIIIGRTIWSWLCDLQSYDFNNNKQILGGMYGYIRFGRHSLEFFR